MNKFIEEIFNILKKDKRLFSKDDNKLLKGELISLISKDDEKLLGLLASNKEIEKRFFKKVGKLTIFQKENFLQLITMNEFLPDSFTAFEVNIGLSKNKKLMSSQEDISLVFPHKDCILEGGQDKEDTKREEIFYNTTLAPDEVDRLKEPKVLTNWKQFDSKGEHKMKEVSLNDNLVIKGNNLMALYSLLPNYRNKVKLIYIDPPYNTGNDEFKYNDSFNHSSWLTFVKNRLEIAKELMTEDGVIFVQCDHHELGYINILMDEIFEQKNKIQIISIKTSAPAGFKTVNPGPIDVTEYILYYSKNKSKVSFKKSYTAVNYNKNYNLFIDNIDAEPEKWKIIPLIDKFYESLNIKNNSEAKKMWGENWKRIRDVLVGDFALKNADRVVSKRDPHNPTENIKKLMKDSSKVNYVIEFKREKRNSLYLYGGGSLAFYKNKLKKINGIISPTELLTDFWPDISWAGIANEGGVKLKNGKKPERLLRRIIEMNSEKNDIILDFFAGSGTTGAVAHKMNRQYILVEQMDYIHDLPEARLKNVIKGDQTGISKDVNWKGGGSFVYTELLEWNNKYIRELESVKTKSDIKKIKTKLEKEAFYKYQIDTSKFDNKKFDKLSEKEQKEVLIDVLDMNHLYVNIDSINDATFSVSKEDKELNKKFYNQK